MTDIFLVTTSFIGLVVNLLLATYEVILSIPYYYSEYKSHKHRTLKTRFKEIARISKLAYKHQVKPIVTKGVNFSIGINFKKLYNPKVYRSLGLVAIALVFLFTIFNPNDTLKATSLTWSNNADFSANRPGKCGETTSSNIIVSGNSYIDPACTDPGEDASLSLQKGGVVFSDVKEISSGNDFTIALKSDGTVWSWGRNQYGQLGDNTKIDRKLPEQVKDTTGNSFLTNILNISAGATHVLALNSEGTIWAWGKNGNDRVIRCEGSDIGGSGGGQLGNGSTADSTLPSKVKNSTGSGFLSNVSQISAGSYHSMAVLNDGTVWGWGGDMSGQLGFGGGTNTRSLPIQTKGPGGVGFLNNVKSISTMSSCSSGEFNVSHTLALLNDGTVWGWGGNNKGQLGDGTASNRLFPTQVKDETGNSFLNNVRSLSASYWASYAVLNDGTAVAWGFNNKGQLGDGTITDKILPVRIKNQTGDSILSNINRVIGGQLRATAVLNDETVLSWGSNNFGQIGNGSLADSSLPALVKNPTGDSILNNIKMVSANYYHSIALTNSGTLYGWGYNFYDQVGYGEKIQTQRVVLPVVILRNFTTNTITDVKSVSSGPNFSLLLKNDGSVWAWGLNTNGQLGDGTTEQRFLPVQVKDSSGNNYLSNIKQISAGGGALGSYALALDNDGTVWSWGLGSSGQLGNGVFGSSILPTKVKNSSGSGNLNDVIKISTGSYFSGAIKSDGSIWMWGANGAGQLGDGTGTNRNLPVQVKDSSGTGFLSNFIDLSIGHNGANAGLGSSLAVRSDGTVWSWGSNNSGALGDGTYTNRSLPVQVRDSSGTSFFSGAKMVSIQSSNDWLYGGSIILKTDGTLWSWGYSVGPTGHNTASIIPVQVKDSTGLNNITNISQVTCGHYTCLAIDNSGELWSWGGGAYGSLGDGTFSDRRFPNKVKDVDGLTNINSISSISVNGFGGPGTSSSTSLISKNDGSVFAFGSNIYGQLGNYSTVDRNLPNPVLSSVIFTDGHLPLGESSGYIVDQGPTKKTKWLSVNWDTNPLPAKTSVKFSTRTSNNGVNWSNWVDQGTQTLAGSTGDTADLTDLPFSRFIELKVTLANTDFFSSPTVNSFSLSLLDDTTTPPTNASNIVMKKSVNGQVIQEESWNNSAKPYFTWQAAEDNAGGSGIGAYCLYLGQDSTADVMSTKGILGNSPVDTDGKCQFAVPSSELDLSVDGMLSEAIA